VDDPILEDYDFILFFYFFLFLLSRIPISFFSLFFRLLKIYLVVKGMGKNVGIIVLDVFILSFQWLKENLRMFYPFPFLDFLMLFLLLLDGGRLWW
jgi:hypothetical protein